MASPLRVLIADDHPLMLAGIRGAVDAVDDIEVVGQASSGPEVMALIERRRPQLVLMDLRMPGVAGEGLIEAIKESWPDVKVVVLSACEDSDSIEGALDAGASAYIVKSVNPMNIAGVLRQAASSSVFLPRSRPGTHPVSEPEEEEPLLTKRERAILESVAAGLTTAAISQNMWVSQHTVKFHLTNIYRKIGVANRAGAVRYALEHGIGDA